ncbi:MAG: cold shock domain-containing protein [Anaerolineae bacterium]
MPYRDTWASCRQCGRQFVFTVEEQRRLDELGFERTPPDLCPDCLRAHEMTPGPHRGIVKWYDPEKGYGFIIQRSGNEIFFHRSGLAPGTPETIPDKTRVRYRVQLTGRGPQAVDVALEK